MKRLFSVALTVTLFVIPCMPLSTAAASYDFSPNDVLVRCTPSPTQSAYINAAFGAYMVEFKVRQGASNLPAQVNTIDNMRYNLNFSTLPLSKKTFDQVYTSRLLSRNITPHDEDLVDTDFRSRLSQQETALLDTNPIITNGLHFVSLRATVNGKPITTKLRHKTADWVLDRNYLSDTAIEQQHQALFQSPTYLIPLIGVLATSNQKSSTLIVSAIGYIGIGLGVAVLQEYIYRRHRQRGALDAVNNYDGDMHADPWTTTVATPDENGYANYRASTLVLGTTNKPVLDFRIRDPQTDKHLNLHYALTCDGSFERPKSGEPIEDFMRLYPGK